MYVCSNSFVFMLPDSLNSEYAPIQIRALQMNDVSFVILSGDHDLVFQGQHLKHYYLRNGEMAQNARYYYCSCWYSRRITSSIMLYSVTLTNFQGTKFETLTSQKRREHKNAGCYLGKLLYFPLWMVHFVIMTDIFKVQYLKC